ncbi:MATE family efflux transporter [Roseimaritima sediminicola]|uniref:MATE family efflux transporter n=1 Tax=Roseimaritima sediminicola TaxID=2662066 RepID=UPI001298559E
MEVRTRPVDRPAKNGPSPRRQRPPSDAYGYRAILAVAVPLAATVGCFAITLFTDRTLLMWYGPTSSAASVAAGNLYWAIVCIPVTAMGFITPLASQALGRRRGRGRTAIRVWTLIWQCVWMTLACLPAFALLAFFSRWMFEAFGHPAALAGEEARYFRTLLLVAPASMLEAGLTAFFVGRRITRPILRANIASSVLNVVLDFWFIFGALGVPAMGVFGAALATALSMWFKVGLFVWLLVRLQSFGRHRGASWKPNLAVMFEIIGPGSTLGIQQLVRSGLFSFVLVAIGAASVTGLAATSAALSLYQLLSIPAIGLATALTVVTGQAFAASGLQQVQQVVRRGLVIGSVVAGGLALLLLIVPDLLLEVSLGGLTAAERAEIEPLAVRLLRFAAVYAVADIAALLLAATIKGLGRTTVILVATALSGCLAVSLGWWLAPPEEAAAAHWWSVLVGWAALQAVLVGYATFRLLRRRHRTAASAASLAQAAS